MRAHELAKELGLPCKDLLEKLAQNGVTVKSNFSAVDDAAIELARKLIAAPAASAVEAPPVAVPPKEPEAAKRAHAKPAAHAKSAAHAKPSAHAKPVEAHKPAEVETVKPEPAPVVPPVAPPAPAEPTPAAPPATTAPPVKPPVRFAPGYPRPPAPVVPPVMPPAPPAPPVKPPVRFAPGYPKLSAPPPPPPPAPKPPVRMAPGFSRPAPAHPQASTSPKPHPQASAPHPQASAPGNKPPPRVAQGFSRPPAPVPQAARPVVPPVPAKPLTPAPPPAAAPAPRPAVAPAAPVVSNGKTVTLKSATSVKELADLLGLKPNILIAELMKMNILASINERMDVKVAQKIAEKHGFAVEREKKPEHTPVPMHKQESKEDEDKPEDLVPRPPIVTVLGHVDHGKTSLLDKIRSTTVAKGESGGITQHIGASTIKVKDQTITFLDTPGHAAFTAMRARGANLTDIAVIVVAADDGIMPQTLEAIKHAQAAEVPIIVAVNKIDLPGANPEQVRQQLAANGLTPEDWGGETIVCPVSAVTGEGIERLLEMILLQAEIMELRANPKRRAKGIVIEAQMEQGMGPTANLLVLTGTLKLGDAVLSGGQWGRIRALINDCGERVKEAGPAVPVKCLGLSGVPEAGGEFIVCQDDKFARDRAVENALRLKDEQMNAPKKVSLESLYEALQEQGRLELKIILRADVQGSVEAILHALEGIKSEKVVLHPILSGVGNVTANDVLLAKASEAIILQFRVGKEANVAQMAKHEGIEVRPYEIIYSLIDDVRSIMAGLLPPELVEHIQGHAEVLKVFALSKGTVAGCIVRDGKGTPRSKVRVLREKQVVHDGTLFSLRRFENDVSEVKDSQECGIRIDNFTAYREGDILEFYEVEKKTPHL
ncbi:MAG: translation initiation factor IF-2 [Kiritimatiellia bacterium]